MIAQTLYLITTLAILAPPSQSELTAIRETLARHSIEPTTGGAHAWLQQLQQPGPYLARLEQALLDLEHEDFSERERATRELEQAAFVPPRLLDAAIQGSEAERRWRAQRVRERSENRQASLLCAVLRQITAAPSPGTAVRLADALILARNPDLVEDLLAEIRRCSSSADGAELRRRLASRDAALRRGAVAGLAASTPENELANLLPVLNDPDELVAIETARGLLDRGERRAIPALVARLASPRVEIRATALGILRSATRQDFGFDPYDSLERQAEALAAWRNWIVSDALTIRLDLPIRWRPSARGDLGGNTLVSTGRRGQVLEFDPQGRVVWRFPASAWSAEKLANGHVLIAAFENQQVLEVDSVGNTRWQLDGIAATRAKPLLNGNVLIADYQGKRVVEVNRRRTIVWQLETPEPCFDAERLANGHTIFGCSNLIREVTPDARTVREWPLAGRLNGLQSLPNGRLLVANFGGNHVAEIDLDGREVWRYDEPQPSDAFRLADGHTLITTASRIVEIDLQKQLVREWAKAAYGSGRR